MITIGLLGGVASGKSLVAEAFRELGAAILDGDRAGHEVLELEEVKQALRARWGERVFTAEGAVHRPAVAAIVFGPGAEPAAERAWLETVTHPRIGELLLARLSELGQSRPPAVVLDAPLMLEAGWDRMCDLVVFVDAPPDLRRSRAVGRGWREEDFAAREGAQESLDRKRARADVVIDNSGSAAATRQQVARVWREAVARDQ